jgi:hypothetical protein
VSISSSQISGRRIIEGDAPTPKHAVRSAIADILVRLNPEHKLIKSECGGSAQYFRGSGLISINDGINLLNIHNGQCLASDSLR